jgi:uncharacterized membrane protein
MALKVKLSRQPIRRVMMLFPLGLLVTSVVFDFGYIVTRRTVIAAVADWTIAAGVIAGLLAAPLSWLTWSGIRTNNRSRALAWWHGVGQALLLVLFASSWFLRLNFPQNYEAALMFSFAGVAVALVTGWLGTELLKSAGLPDSNDPKRRHSVTSLRKSSAGRYLR